MCILKKTIETEPELEKIYLNDSKKLFWHINLFFSHHLGRNEPDQ